MPARSEPLPVVVGWLGYGGALPFVATALAARFDPAHASLWAFALLAYGAVIVSFVGALHWGIAMSALRAGDDLVRRASELYAWSVMPALLAWVALLSHAILAHGMAWAAVLLVLAFGAHYVRDRRLTTALNPPAWYLPLRRQLTAVACLSLLSLYLPPQAATAADAAKATAHTAAM
ncbi:MAG: DUF3429 domain-containing protein [Burkholderiales bacterium]